MSLDAVEGVVDGFDYQGVLRGWAYSKKDPNTPVDIEVFFSGKLQGVAKAKSPREDLHWLSNKNVGFIVSIPQLVDPTNIANGTISVAANGRLLPSLKSFMLYNPQRSFWNRKVMDEKTFELIRNLKTEELDALEISGKRWGRIIRWRTYRTVEFPDFDLNKDIILDQKFDIIFAEQVFEHLRYPYRCVRNIHSMLNAGGWFLVTTPFLVCIHGVPEDYTRWSEDGMRYLLEEGGFSPEKTITGSWGNIDCVIADLKAAQESLNWNWFDADLHSLFNNPRYPTAVWALAQREN